jgi:SAM-dependent methyltransferase
MLYKTHRDRTEPLSGRDKAIWQDAVLKKDLLEYLYKGVTGYFQRRGHKIIHRWSQRYKDEIVLEIGTGHGYHLEFGERYRSFVGLDISSDFLKTAKTRYQNKIVPVQGNAYNLPFKDNSVDAILAIYILEHLKQLSRALKEVKRVLRPSGSFFVGLPCEGGFCYNVGREFTSKPYMEKKYGIDYDAVIKHEHCNEIWDILKDLKEHFKIRHSKWIPLFLPTYHLNIITCLDCVPHS